MLWRESKEKPLIIFDFSPGNTYLFIDEQWQN